ncbi:hypothetical protein DRN58_06915 [Thermococci archaeon]|nr:MAG: hypothetical protein DRN58_06915 [Thermococci archaeon]
MHSPLEINSLSLKFASINKKIQALSSCGSLVILELLSFLYRDLSNANRIILPLPLNVEEVLSTSVPRPFTIGSPFSD